MIHVHLLLAKKKKRMCRAKRLWLFPVIPFFFSFSRLPGSKQEPEINSRKAVVSAYSVQASSLREIIK